MRTVLSLCLFLTACNAQINVADGGTSSTSSSSGGSSSGGVAAFIGTWGVVGNGSFGFGSGGPGMTTDGSAAIAPTNYQIAVSEGTTSDLQSVDSYGCLLEWNVSGNKATLGPNQTCNVTEGGSTVVVSLTSTDVVLTVVDAKHLAGSGNANGACSGTGVMSGTSMFCFGTAAGTLIKAD